MRTGTTLVAAVLAASALLGWLAASGKLTTALAEDKSTADPPSIPGTPSVLPRPDFHFAGNVGRTYKDSDPPQFP
jgi:arylsulfatase